ncbi:hypothetical protein NIES4073_38930 [Kalymmatonema gypsitolerans NIES-4073]|nr:hypothetical protein NIES4073_38930 [Scytonema sp. NIES-4073]
MGTKHYTAVVLSLPDNCGQKLFRACNLVVRKRISSWNFSFCPHLHPSPQILKWGVPPHCPAIHTHPVAGSGNSWGIQLKSQIAQYSSINPEKVLRELARIAFASIPDVIIKQNVW